MRQLKELRKLHQITQARLANMLGVARSTISMWETAECQPDNETLVKLAQIFNTTVDCILGNSLDSDTQPSPKGVKIPVLGNVQAGIPVEAIEEILDYEEITPRMARTGEFFGLRIRGSSMEPRFVEGDVIIVRQQPDCDTGDIAVVMVNSDDATVKKIKKTAAGITLIPTNPAFDPLFYSWDEAEELPVRILGKVVELRAKF